MMTLRPDPSGRPASPVRALAATAAAVLLLLAAVAATSAGEPAADGPVDAVRFDGDRVVRVEIDSAETLRLMLRVSPDPWSHRFAIGAAGDFRVPADRWEDFRRLGLDHEVMIEDVQAIIDAQAAARELEGPAGTFFGQYRRYDEVMTFIDDLAAERPDLAEVVDLGDSLQGRAIRGLRITGPGTETKPGLVFNGCQHAREWVTVMAMCYIADRLVGEYDVDADVRAIVDRREIWIIPIVNPDGYVYTWTTNRLWRKNRAAPSGVDLNRNWSYEWGGRGSSGRETSEVYRGPYEFSEPETRAVARLFEDHPSIVAHVDVHCYSQLVLQPWGFTIDLPEDHDRFETLGAEMAAAMGAVDDKVFRHGPAYTTIYPAAGIMSDWTYGRRRAWGLSYELRDRGQFGFLLPPDQIVVGSEEAWAGFEALATADLEPIPVLDVGPLVRGEAGTLTANRMEPGAPTYFFYSLQGEGETFWSSLGVTLDLGQPVLGGTAVADAEGRADFEAVPPTGVPIFVVWIQATNEGGRTTNVVLTQVN